MTQLIRKCFAVYFLALLTLTVADVQTSQTTTEVSAVTRSVAYIEKRISFGVMQDPLFYVPTGTTVHFVADASDAELLQSHEYCWQVGHTWLDGRNCEDEFTGPHFGSNAFYETFMSPTPCGAMPDGCGISIVGIRRSSLAQKAVYFTVIVLDKISGQIDITDLGPLPALSAYLISIDFDQLPTDPCIVVDFGTSQVSEPYRGVIALGSEYMCADFTHSNAEIMSTLRRITADERSNKDIQVATMYLRAGVYTVTVNVTNKVDSRGLEKTVIVTTGAVLMNCSSSNAMSVTWTIWFKNVTSAGDFVNVTDLYLEARQWNRPNFTGVLGNPIWQDVDVTVAAGKLAFGRYRFVIKVHMLETPLLAASDFKEFTVGESDLYAAFAPGPVYSAEYPHTFVVDGLSLSYDPDVVPGTNISAKDGIEAYYFCKKECEPEWPQFTGLDDVRKFITGTHKWIVDLRGKPNPACRASDADGDELQYSMPGCFIKSGHLNFPLLTGDLTVNASVNSENGEVEVAKLYSSNKEAKTINFTSKFMFEYTNYNFLVALVKDHRWVLARQTINLARGEPVYVSIQTRTNCRKPFKSAFLLSTTSRASFAGIVANRLASQVYDYHWMLIELPQNISVDYATDHLEEVTPSFAWQDEALTNITSTGTASADLSINAFALDSPFFYGKFMLIRLDVTRRDSLRGGTAVLAIFVNRPPSSDQVICKAAPVTGTEAITPFSFNCSNFSSQCFGAVSKFSLSAVYCPTCAPVSLTSTVGSPLFTNMPLSAGFKSQNYNVTVIVSAFDEIGSFSKNNFTITVLPIPPENGYATVSNLYTGYCASVASMSTQMLSQTVLAVGNFMGSLSSTNSSVGSKNTMMLHRVNMSRWLLLRDPGIDLNSLRTFCASIVSLIGANDTEQVAIDELEDNAIEMARKAIEQIRRAEQDPDTDADALESGVSSCLEIIGKLMVILDYHQNSAIKTSAGTEAVEPDSSGYYSPTILAREPLKMTRSNDPAEVLSKSRLVNELAKEAINVVFKRKVLNEKPSYIGLSSLRVAVSILTVANLENASLNAEPDDPCEAGFQLRDALKTFAPHYIEEVKSMGGQNVSDESILKSAVKVKVISQVGNPYASQNNSLNSQIETLVFNGLNGAEIVLNDLPYYVEIRIPGKPGPADEVKRLSAMTSPPHEKMKTISGQLRIDSAFHVSIERWQPNLEEICSNKSLSTEITLGVFFCQNGTEITSEEVVYFVYLIDNSGDLITPMLNCSLPNDRILSLYLEAGGTTTSTTVSLDNNCSSTTLAPGPRDTKPINSCGVKKVRDVNTCFSPVSQVASAFANFPNDSNMSIKMGIRAFTVTELRLAIQEILDANQTADFDWVHSYLIKTLPQSRSTRVGFTFISYLASCKFWDEAQETWSTRGCFVGPVSNPLGTPMTQCFCNHLTSFASALNSPMNTFDPKNSAFIYLDQNPICFTFAICIFCCYLTGLIWARKRDKEDEERWGTIPLLTNDPRDTYAYEMVVWTGYQSGSGTSARVSFILLGDEGETFPHRFEQDIGRSVLQTNSVDSFLLLTPRSLGKLTQLRIWHDNSGSHPNWHLLRVLVHDLQRRRQYYFLCGQWLAVDEGDGKVERILPVAGKTELASFEHFFSKQWKHQLNEHHIWVSAFIMSTLSKFTRCQRLTCCISLLYCIMSVNIMFFAQYAEQPGSTRFSLGVCSLSLTKLMTSIISALVVLPMNLLIIQLFRLAKRRPMRRERKMDAFCQNLTKINRTRKRNYKKDKRISLPWWSTFFGYFLAACTCGVAFWAVIEIGGDLSPERAQEWLLAVIITLITDIFFLQPLKILIQSILYSLFVQIPAKENGMEERTIFEEEVDGHDKQRKEGKQLDYVLLPPDPEELRLTRDRRIKERKTRNLLKDIALSLFFACLLMIVAYGNQDDFSITLQKHLRRTFLEPIRRVTNENDFFGYLQAVLLPALMDPSWYNGAYDYKTDRFTNDQTLFMVGSLRLRQLRVANETCQVVDHLRNYYEGNCLAAYSISDEDRRNFTTGWQLLAPSGSNTTLSNDGWTYTADFDSPLFQAFLSTYNGGGYIADLGQTLANAQLKVDALMKNKWLDSQTRAVFLEFNLYSPNRNMFAISQTVVEFFAGGSIVLYPYFHVTRLDPYIGTTAYLILGFEFFTFLVVIGLLFHEIRLVFQHWKTYWFDMWAVVDLFHLVACFVTGVLFIVRYNMARPFIGTSYKKSNRLMSNANFSMFITYDQVVQGFVAGVIFVAFIKMTRLLRVCSHTAFSLSAFRHVRSSILSLFAIFTMVCLAFAQLGYLAIGSQDAHFSNIVSAMETLFGMTFGVIRYQKIVKSNQTVGGFLFGTFSCFVNIILVNLFLSILINVYEDDHCKTPGNESKDYEIIDFIVTKLKAFVGQPPKQTPNLLIDRRFVYIENAAHEDIVDRFTRRISELIDKLDVYIEKSKLQRPELFFKSERRRLVYATD